jgi:hypothetical protein
LLWLAWRFGNEDPYVLYNGPNAEEPKHPSRRRLFLYGCAAVAGEHEGHRMEAAATGGISALTAAMGGGGGRGRRKR